MKAYFDNVRKDVPENIHDIFLEKEGTAVITIDMHEGLHIFMQTPLS